MYELGNVLLFRYLISEGLNWSCSRYSFSWILNLSEWIKLWQRNMSCCWQQPGKQLGVARARGAFYDVLAVVGELKDAHEELVVDKAVCIHAGFTRWLSFGHGVGLLLSSTAAWQKGSHSASSGEPVFPSCQNFRFAAATATARLSVPRKTSTKSGKKRSTTISDNLYLIDNSSIIINWQTRKLTNSWNTYILYGYIHN